MFPDTDLPLALIMEEILGWEKKEDSDTEKEDTASQQHLSTRNKKSAGDCYIFHRLLNFIQTKILIPSGCQGFRFISIFCCSCLLRPVSTSLIFRLSAAHTAQNLRWGPVRAAIYTSSNLSPVSTVYCPCSWPNTPEWGRFHLTQLRLLSPHGVSIYVNRRRLCAVLHGAACLICPFSVQYLGGLCLNFRREKFLSLITAL